MSDLGQTERSAFSALAWELAKHCVFGVNPAAEERIFAVVTLAGEPVRATGHTSTEAMRRLAVLLDERASDFDHERVEKAEKQAAQAIAEINRLTGAVPHV